MSSEHILIQAEPRTPGKSSDAKRLRKQGRVPGVLYSQGNAGVHVSINAHDYMMSLKGHPSENLILDLKLDGDTHTCLLREVQQEPLSGELLHLDFNEVRKGQKLHVPVHIELHGDAPGVKDQGGVLEFVMDLVDVECTPDNLPEKIELDISSLAMNERLTVGDLDLSGLNVTVTTDPEAVVAQVTPPRVLEEDEDEESEEGADAAGPAGQEDSGENSEDAEESDKS